MSRSSGSLLRKSSWPAAGQGWDICPHWAEAGPGRRTLQAHPGPASRTGRTALGSADQFENLRRSPGYWCSAAG